MKDKIKGLLAKPITVKKLLFGLVMLMVAISLMAADNGCNSQTNASFTSEQNAANKWGSNPNITNYYEYLQLKQIYELRDNPKLVLNAYLYSQMTGQLTCLGQVIGFGIPYGTSWSQFQDSTGQSVSEPNGLFPSQNTNADWVQLIGPDGKPHVSFVEPDLIITDQNLPCTPLGGK